MNFSPRGKRRKKRSENDRNSNQYSQTITSLSVSWCGTRRILHLEPGGRNVIVLHCETPTVITTRATCLKVMNFGAFDIVAKGVVVITATSCHSALLVLFVRS